MLLISHSQGNLFANRIYDTINPTEYKAYFANLQIASPASEVKAEKGDYVTLSTDLTSVDPVINFIPGSMSPNASGDSGHALVSAYLSQADPLSKIITKIKQLLSNLDTEPSQWELDQELNKDTENYKITLKHRFDTSITSMQGVEVYPFNASKKLYHVLDNTGGNGWVKASCGGEEVFDYWDGQENNESYLINNDEREKIILKTKQFSFILNYDLEYTLTPTTNSGIKYHRGISYTYIAPDTNCTFPLAGGGYNNYGFVDSGDDYFLNQELSYERKEWERYYIQTTNRNVKCIINSHGYEVSQTEPIMLRGEETRAVVESSDTKKHYLLEQEYIIKIKN